MVQPEDFVGALGDRGADFLTGVPCTYLRGLTGYLTAGSCRYYAATVEGEALAMATGAWLGGSLGVVLLQNSGLGNCINPLTSLSMMFDIPAVLVISHRGEGGNDSPEHMVMGRILYDLLAVLGVPTWTLPAGREQALATVDEACSAAVSSMCPVALIAPRGTFEETARATMTAEASPLHAPAPIAPRPVVLRREILGAVSEALDDADLTVSTTGMTSRELFSAGDRDGNFYMSGSMGCAAGIGLGIALQVPARRVVVFDGDGAALMKLGSLATIGHYRPGGLLHVVLDNGAYESTGGQATVSTTVDFPGLAAAAGYRRVESLARPQQVAELVRDFSPCDGPVFCHVPILSGHASDVPRVGPAPHEIRDRFRACAARYPGVAAAAGGAPARSLTA